MERAANKPTGRGRLSSAFLAWVSERRPSHDSLPLYAVLEEEFAALHAGSDLPSDAIPAAFVPADIIDLAGFARTLLDAHERLDARASSGRWRPRPPAPAQTPLQQVAELVIHEQPLLVGVLRAQVEAADRGAVGRGDACRAALADRLTSLCALDLAGMPAFAPSIVAARRANSSFDALTRAEQNRMLIEDAFVVYLATTTDRRLAGIFARIRDARHSALCLSGGGIRSASFALGVVQGLARRGLLARFDYLSTVSGGGYTGSWLSAWMARAGARTVREELKGPRTAKVDEEPAPIRHLRAFSYYLNPSFGMLSADTWTLLATVARNILLIWLVTLPLMAAALMVPRLFVALPMTTLQNWNENGIDPGDLAVALTVIGAVLATTAIAFVHRHMHISRRDEAGGHADAPVTVRQFLTWCLVPLVVAFSLFAQLWDMIWSMVHLTPEQAAAAPQAISRHEWVTQLVALDPLTMNEEGFAIVMGAGFWMLIYIVGWLVGARRRRYSVVEGITVAFTGAIVGAIGAVATARTFGLTNWSHRPETYAMLAVPMGLLGLFLGMLILVGLTSRRMSDAERESNARFSAWLLIVIVAWTVTFGIALHGPILLREAFGAAVELRALIGVSGIVGLAVAVLAASSRLAGPGGSSRNAADAATGFGAKARTAAIALATPVFAVVLIMAISMFNAWMLGAVCGRLSEWCTRDPSQGRIAVFGGREDEFLTAADFAAPQIVVGALLALLLIGYILARLINTNRFSLHAMYRVRLVRTFLGASKAPADRDASPLTGFDATDDMPVGDLWPARHASTAPAAADATDHPPIHVVNLALNLVAGNRLAVQGRKADSFTVTALHAGAASVGFRRTSARDTSTRLYGGKGGITLGTAMAISGAAASPNAGYHSSPVVTFLMTLFNARLGWWLGNPGPAGDKSFDDDEPRLAVVPILEEMFGRTTDASPYVYLSDGGHFENLGLYEMVRRRNRFIVVSDAGCDPKGKFDDLGGAIRKIRIDFGIPIEFAEGISIACRSAGEPESTKPYWAIGRIHYARADRDDRQWPGKTDADYDGVLLYIKPAFYGREPRDVCNYAASTPDFPHESTANQFFGEAQLESYRALGSHVIDQLCEAEFGVHAHSRAEVPADVLDRWLSDRTRVHPDEAQSD